MNVSKSLSSSIPSAIFEDENEDEEEGRSTRSRTSTRTRRRWFLLCSLPKISDYRGESPPILALRGKPDRGRARG